jgi:hypothetical protein
MTFGLEYRGNADFFRTKNTGDLSEHTGTILNFQANIKPSNGFPLADQFHLSARLGNGWPRSFVPKVFGGFG